MFVKRLGSPLDPKGVTVILVMTQERERMQERAGGAESQAETSPSQHVMEAGLFPGIMGVSEPTLQGASGSNWAQTATASSIPAPPSRAPQGALWARSANRISWIPSAAEPGDASFLEPVRTCPRPPAGPPLFWGHLSSFHMLFCPWSVRPLAKMIATVTPQQGLA